MNENDFAHLMANPFYCIVITPALAGPHETLISREEWCKVQKIAIEENGLDAWLETLLSVLEGNYPTDDGFSPVGYQFKASEQPS